MVKTRVFISYSSKDVVKAEKIHQELAAEGLEVWRDKTRLETDWSREIAYALAESDILCLLWSEHASQSKWVNHEWLTGRAIEKHIVPVILQNAPALPKPLFNAHGIKLEEDNLKKCCGTILKRVKLIDPLAGYDYSILPASFYIPFNHNPHFTGRHSDLLELYLKMIGNLNKVGINQIGTVGMGGVGKTQLVVEFAYRFSFYFNSIHWIQAADKSKWRSQFVELARDRLKLEISDPKAPDAEKRYISELQNYCTENRQTLLIIDNVTEPEFLNNDTYLFGITPLTLGCNLLFTTRKHFNLKDVVSQSVDVLSSESAYKLLTADRKPDIQEEEKRAMDICNSVGYLPLALVLAGGYLNKYKDVSYVDYYEELQNNKLNSIDIGEVTQEEIATRHVAAVTFTLNEDWKRLSDNNARQIFQLAGQFGESEIIPKARLGLLSGIESGKTKLHRPLDKAFNLLQDLCLIEILESNTQSIRLHPLVRDFANKLIPVEEQSTFRAIAAEKSKNAFFEYHRLECELKERGVQELLDDLQIDINWWRKNSEDIQDLRLLQSTLRLSANQLARDPRQLAPHLIGRLKKTSSKALRQLADQAEKGFPGCWLRPCSASLMPPGGPLLCTLEGHSGLVNALSITPNGQTAVSASTDHTLKVWDLKSGTLQHSLEGHSGSVNTVAISPNGQTVVSASNDCTIKVWDLKRSSLQKSLEGHKERVTVVKITPDGQMIVSTSSDNTLKLWNINNGELQHSLEGHSSGVSAVAFTPDGQTAVSASMDRTLKVWDLKSGSIKHTLEGHSGSVNDVAISPNGQMAVSASNDCTIKVWDLKSGVMQFDLKDHSQEIYAVLITPDGQVAVSASRDKTLKVWDLKIGALKCTLEGHSIIVNALAITPDGEMVVSASWDETLKVWDLKRGALQCSLEGHNGIVRAVMITPDGHTAVSASYDSTLKVWDLKNNAMKYNQEGHKDYVNAIAITPDGQLAISASSDKTLMVWDLKSGALKCRLEGHSRPVYSVAITPDGQTAVSASGDKTLKVWDLKSGALERSLEGHGEPVYSVAITPDGQTAVSASGDKTLKVWDMKSGALKHSMEGHSERVCRVVITHDGLTVVSASWDNTLKVWDLKSGKVQYRLEGHKNFVNTVIVTPNGQTTVSASDDHTLRVWNLKNGELQHCLEGHSQEVYAMAITPNGQTVVSASKDKTLKVWDLKSGILQISLKGHNRGVSAVAITPDGQIVVSSSFDNTLKVWDLQNGKEIAQFVGESRMQCCTVASDSRTFVAGEESGQVHILRLEGV